MCSVGGGKKGDLVTSGGAARRHRSSSRRSVLVSSWREQVVYRGKDEEFSSLLEGIAAPADIGWDSRRNRLLVPRSASNQVTIHALR
jgi:hypothetical protein